MQRMGAHGRLARLCAVGGVAASFALVKVMVLKKKRSIGNSQGVEKRQEGRWFLTEREVRGGGQLRSRGPTWQVVHNFLVKSLRKPIVCSQQTAKL